MVNTLRSKFSGRLIFITALLMATLTWCAPDASAQTSTPPANAAAADQEAGIDVATEPVLKDYKGVRIGMSADEARQRLGKPETKSNKQELFLISDNEFVQVFYDKDGKVNAVAITFTEKNSAAPTALAVLGEDVPAGSDGRIHKLVRYPKAGYWVAYNRSAGDSPIVSVTMKKVRVISP